MSRSGYDDDYEGSQWDHIRWRGAVASAIRGKRGQAFLKEMLAALDAMPEKQLIRNDLMSAEGEVCALGAVGAARDMNLDSLDPYDREAVAGAFDIPLTLACEIMWANDDQFYRATPEQRWALVRQWVSSQIKAPEAT